MDVTPVEVAAVIVRAVIVHVPEEITMFKLVWVVGCANVPETVGVTVSLPAFGPKGAGAVTVIPAGIALAPMV